MTIAAQAQFINNGATVTIQNGATLRVETNIENNGTGTITNNGIIEVSGNFTNAGTAFLTPGAGLVKFIGATNTTLNTGGDALYNVEMAKTSSATVTLAAPATIANNLSFTGAGSKIVLGANDLTLTLTPSDPISAAVDHPTNGYVVTDGAGKLVKSISVDNATFVHEVGDATNYTPVSSNVTGTSYSSATLAARVVDATHPSKPVEADSYISRYWVVNANGISTYSNTLTGNYASSGDANGTPSRIKGASFVSPNWSFINAATNGSSTVTGTVTTNSVDFTGMNALNKVDITAYLFGAMPISGTTMTNDLQTYSPLLLPTISQYGAPTTTYNDIANPVGVAGNVTDWVKVEIRSASNPATILETRSLLLKTSGHIVDATGGLPYFKDQSSQVRIAISHRNHLSILSNSIAGTFEGKNEFYNFSSGLSQASNDFSDPDQMRLKNGVWCLIAGDMNSDNAVDANDVPIFFTSFNNNDFDTYIFPDLNMDGAVDANDAPLFFYSFNLNSYSTIINY